MFKLVGEMSREELLEEYARVEERLFDLRLGRSKEGTVQEMKLRLERLKGLLEGGVPQQLQTEAN